MTWSEFFDYNNYEKSLKNYGERINNYALYSFNIETKKAFKKILSIINEQDIYIQKYEFFNKLDEFSKLLLIARYKKNMTLTRLSEIIGISRKTLEKKLKELEIKEKLIGEHKNV